MSGDPGKAPPYKLRVCPVCLTQMEDDECCWHDEFRNAITPIGVRVDLDAADLQAKRGLALFRLEQLRRESDFAAAERRWYENLSVADRFWEDVRRDKARRQAQAARLARIPSTLGRFEEIMRSAWSEELVTRQFFGGDIFAWRPPDLDDWLAEDGLPEVAKALGL